jgi:protein subunit release factor B
VGNGRESGDWVEMLRRMYERWLAEKEIKVFTTFK